MPQPEAKSSIQVIERMITLLDVLAHHQDAVSLKQLSRETGLHPSTAHRILGAMTASSFVERAEPGAYRLGIRLLELGNIVKSRINIREIALPFMQALHGQIGESVNLGIRHDDEIIYVERTSSGRSSVRVVHLVGARAPLVAVIGLAAGTLLGVALAEGMRTYLNLVLGRVEAPHPRGGICAPYASAAMPLRRTRRTLGRSRPDAVRRRRPGLSPACARTCIRRADGHLRRPPRRVGRETCAPAVSATPLPRGATAPRRPPDRTARPRGATAARGRRAGRSDRSHRRGRRSTAVVPPPPRRFHTDDNGAIRFGRTAVMEDLESGEEMSYKLVGPYEADVQAGTISVTSPLGKALIGKEAGDEVRVQTPKGVKNFEILEVQ